LDTWQRSGLPAGDFAALIGMSKHTLYDWKRKFQSDGPAGLMDRPRGGPAGSRLPELLSRYRVWKRRHRLLVRELH
jgi:transposase